MDTSDDNDVNTFLDRFHGDDISDNTIVLYGMEVETRRQPVSLALVCVCEGSNLESLPRMNMMILDT